MRQLQELALGEAESDNARPSGARLQLSTSGCALALICSSALVAFGAAKLSHSLPWASAPPGLVAVSAALVWGTLALGFARVRGRPRPHGRFVFGEQIEVSLIEGWCALLSWGEVLSYRERGAGVELRTTRPPPRPNKAGILPDLPQTLWVPTRDEAERAQLLRLLRTKKIPRLR
jgi:hypothetical protein